MRSYISQLLAVVAVFATALFLPFACGGGGNDHGGGSCIECGSTSECAQAIGQGWVCADGCCGQVSSCQAIFDEAYQFCSLTEVDAYGNAIPEYDVVQECLNGTNGNGLGGAYVACIVDFWDDCSAIETCLENSPIDDDDDNDDNDTTPPTCQSVYDKLYADCGFHFHDASGNGIPESVIVADCESGNICYELTSAIAECVVNNWSDCTSIEACIAQHLPCGDDDDNDDNNDNDNDDNDASPVDADWATAP